MKTNENTFVKSYKNVYTVGIVLLLLSIWSQYLITNSLGGILKSIQMGDILRSITTDNANYIPSNRLFAFILMITSLASFFLLTLSNRIKATIMNRSLIVISYFTSVFYLLFNAGRLGMILFFMTIIVDFSIRNTKRPFIIILSAMLIGILMLPVLDNFFFYLTYGYIKSSSSSGIQNLLNEFAFPYLNVIKVFNINEIYGLRWGLDLVNWSINLIPTRILNLVNLNKSLSGYLIITDFHLGVSAMGGVPTDILTLGIRQFGMFGSFITLTLIAYLARLIDSKLGLFFQKDYFFIVVRVVSIFILIVPYADLDSMIRNRYDYIILIIAVFKLSSTYKRKIEDKNYEY